MNPAAMMPVTLAQLPTIGMVTAPVSSGGHVGIGIGIPIMTSGGAPPMLQQSPPVPSSSQQSSHSHQHEFVSPDSSDDRALHRTQSPPLLPTLTHHQHPGGSNGSLPPPWPPAQFLAGMGYPLMAGLGPGTPLLEPNLYFGINFVSPHPGNSVGPISVPDLPPMMHHHQSMPTGNLIQSPGPVPVAPVPTTPQQVQQGPSLPNFSPAKEIIHCKSCTLFPPNPAAPLPTTREKPSGCRTVFVGGLPENMTDDLVREAFERCGEITTVRMSKKNFCHIRFELEDYVDNAVYLSGYRIRIGSNSDNANIGRFHVDFAQARDDFYEWECRQRQFQREQRHRDRVETERLPPASPPPVIHFSEHEAAALAENIKVDDHFMKSIQVLITWLERGDCTKRSACTFYSMVQSTNSHLKRLLKEKGQYEEELRKVKALATQRIQGLSVQFSQVEKVFLAASHKKAWDHFTKAQRKNIDGWKKSLIEMLNEQREDHSLLKERLDEEMDLSDLEQGEQHPEKRRRLNSDDFHQSNNQLKEENDSLRCQLEAYKNELNSIRADLKGELELKDSQIKVHKTWLVDARSSDDANPKLLNAPHQLSPTQSDIEFVTSQPQSSSSCPTEEGQGDNQNRVAVVVPPIVLETNCDSSSTAKLPAHNNEQQSATTPSISSSSSSIEIGSTNRNEVGEVSSGGMIPEIEARLIGIIATFLNVHPFGASLEYICSFTQKVLPAISGSEIQSLLLKFPGVFRQELSGIGASLERKWTFIGFSNN